MTVAQEKQAFLNALKDNPTDETTHRVFADWLYEHGMDNEADIHAQWDAETHRRALHWLIVFAEECSITLDKLLEGMDKYVATGRMLCLPIDTPDRAFYDIDTLWEKYQYVRFLLLNFDEDEDEDDFTNPRVTKRFIRCEC